MTACVHMLEPSAKFRRSLCGNGRPPNLTGDRERVTCGRCAFLHDRKDQTP